MTFEFTAALLLYLSLSLEVVTLEVVSFLLKKWGFLAFGNDQCGLQHSVVAL